MKTKFCILFFVFWDIEKMSLNPIQYISCDTISFLILNAFFLSQMSYPTYIQSQQIFFSSFCICILNEEIFKWTHRFKSFPSFQENILLGHISNQNGLLLFANQNFHYKSFLHSTIVL